MSWEDNVALNFEDEMAIESAREDAVIHANIELWRKLCDKAKNAREAGIMEECKESYNAAISCFYSNEGKDINNHIIYEGSAIESFINMVDEKLASKGKNR